MAKDFKFLKSFSLEIWQNLSLNLLLCADNVHKVDSVNLKLLRGINKSGDWGWRESG